MSEEGGPLTKLLQDNSGIVEAAIEEYGPGNVAAFFINFGFGMATAYALPNFNWQNASQEGVPAP